MAALTYRVALECRVCGELALEGESLTHRDRRFGGPCSNHGRDDTRRMSWRRQQVVVLARTWLHQELRWPVP